MTTVLRLYLLCALVAVLSPLSRAASVDLQPLATARGGEGEIAVVTALPPAQQRQFAEAVAYIQKTLDRVWELDRKHPGEGWDAVALQLGTRLDQLRQTPVRRGTIDDPEVRGYVLWGGTIFLNPQAFWDDATLGGGVPSGASPEAQRIADENQRNLRGAKVMDLSLVSLHEVPHSRYNLLTRRFSNYGGEKQAWTEEYTFFRIMCALDPGYRIHSEQEGAIRDGLKEFGLKPGPELDRQLGIPSRIDRLTVPSSSAAAGTTGVKLDFRQEYTTAGSISRSYYAPAPSGTPADAGARVALTVSNSGKLFLKLEFASDQASGPRFVDDELGYRTYACAYITYNGGKSDRLVFNNNYDKNFASASTTLNLVGGQTVTIQIIPQSAAAYSAETWASDGKNRIYFPGRYKVYANFAGK